MLGGNGVKSMPAIEPLCRLIGINPSKLIKEENFLLEAELFVSICEELKQVFRKQQEEYLSLMKLTTEKENKMLDAKFVHLIIQDILSTKEYNLKGIAHYTDTHEEVIQEIYIGQNINPSVVLFRKIIELHRMVRRDLYLQIIKKIASKYLAVA